MKKSRFPEAQIAFALHQVESGTPVAGIIGKVGNAEQTSYRWKKRYAGLGVGELRLMRNHNIILTTNDNVLAQQAL